MEETEAEQIARMAAEGNAPQQQQPAPTVDYQKLFEDQRAQSQAQQAVMQQQLNQALALAQSAQQTQYVGPAQATAPVSDPYAGFDEATAKALRGVVGNIEATFKQQMAATNQELHNLKASNAGNQIAMLAGPNANPIVLQYAQKLHTNLQSKGVPVTAQEVYDMAYGQAVREGKIQASAPQQQYGQPPVLTGGSRQPVTRNRPVHFDNLPLKEQVKLMEAEPGFHDTEF